MADTQDAPQTVEPLPQLPGSMGEAQEALLGLMDSVEETPKKEEQAEPASEEESTEESEDESLESDDESEDEESEEESEEADEEEDEEEEEQDEVYAVKVNGEDHEVTLDELVKGYSRQSDYTRKTQELSELRSQYDTAKQQYEAGVPELDSLKEQYMRALGETIENSMAGLERFNIDWEALKEEDREEYLVKRDDFRQAQDKIREYQGKKQREEEQFHQGMRQKHSQFLKDEHQKLETLLPEWKKPDDRSNLASQVSNYALSQGFTKEEVGSLVDSRSFVALVKAMRYDELSTSSIKSKKVKNKPKVVRSGTGTSKKQAQKSKKTAQMKRLRESGKERDAVSLLEDFVEL